MISKWRQIVAAICGYRSTRRGSSKFYSHRGRFEVLEDRRMLANPADIVFLIDKSSSAGTESLWIADLVSRIDGLDDYLTDPTRNIDPRYGLVGFGDRADGISQGHSHLLDVNDTNGDGDKLFGNADQLADVVEDVANPGSDERAWDAIEHAIAEYEFRPGAAVIFVMFRRDDIQGGGPYAGNFPEGGGEHTYEGVFAALESFNITLNTVVEATFDPAMIDSMAGGLVLGVDADRTDGAEDGRHIAYVVNPIANQPTQPDVLLASQNGSNSGTFVDSGKSIRISTSATPQIAGPSRANYRAEAATYAFDDISTTGTEVTNWVGSYPSYKQLNSTDLGAFSFDFYGANYNSLYINSGGSITFEAPSDIPSPDWGSTDPRVPRIAPLWSDFDGDQPFEVYWQVKDLGLSTERLIVQWDSMQYLFDLGSSPSDTVTFQAILYGNGEIIYHYQDLELGDEAFTDGLTSTVGIGTDAFTNPDLIPAGVFVDGIHAVNALPGAEKDFVRLAWDTGGVAWNNDVVSGGSGSNQEYVEAFDEAFIESIADQIATKHSRGDVMFADDPLLEINMGGPAMGNYITDTNPMLGPNFLPPGTTTPSTTQSILKNGNSMAGDASTLNVFKTARRMVNDDLNINLSGSLVPDGRYIVELMFSSFSDSYDRMSVLFENDDMAMLDMYAIRGDHGKIPAASAGAPEFEVLPEQLGDGVPVVKRFSVDVADGNGLQIYLQADSGSSPALNGLRILKTPPAAPRVTNVIIKSGFPPGLNGPYEFDAAAGSGEQLRTVPIGGARTIEVRFSEDVNIAAGDLDLIALNRVVAEPAVTQFVAPSSGNNFTASWKFASALPAAQYLLRLSDAIENAAGTAIDGEWTNPGSITTGATTSVFPSGDGVEGGDFEFVFTYLPIDFNRDLLTDSADAQLMIPHYGGTGKLFTQGDANGDASVNSGDAALVSSIGYVDWRTLVILGDYNGSSSLDGDDEDDFLAFYGAQNSAADLTNNGVVDQADYDAFYELLGSGIDLDIIT